MAQRRMFSKVIIDFEEFLEMPQSARLLYYDLGMRADDDGFIQPKRVMKITGASTDDLKILIAKRFVINFDDKVLVISDWKINNNIRSDRYVQTIFTEYKKMLCLGENKRYEVKSVGMPSGIPDVIPEGDAGKDRSGKDRSGEGSENNPPPSLKISEEEKQAELEKKFTLSEENIKKLESEFPSVEVRFECSKAKNLLLANGGMRGKNENKPIKNYMAYLRLWMQRDWVKKKPIIPSAPKPKELEEPISEEQRKKIEERKGEIREKFKFKNG